MLQKEVAERITAIPPDMTILSVATQFFAEPHIEFLVSPTVFIPPPKVESAVIHLDVRPEMPLPWEEQPLFFKILNSGFRQKRKQVAMPSRTCCNCRSRDRAWLQACGVDPMRRAETLSVAEWVTLAKAAPDNVRDA
jgi:16S rRNA (adenine1518-N6/adenine1519-N6)-dimethyltransferase